MPHGSAGVSTQIVSFEGDPTIEGKLPLNHAGKKAPHRLAPGADVANIVPPVPRNRIQAKPVPLALNISVLSHVP